MFTRNKFYIGFGGKPCGILH